MLLDLKKGELKFQIPGDDYIGVMTEIPKDNNTEKELARILSVSDFGQTSVGSIETPADAVSNIVELLNAPDRRNTT